MVSFYNLMQNPLNLWKKPNVCVCPACVQAGTGGIHEGANPLDSNRLLRQSALHQPHRSQDGHPGPAGRGVQGEG